MRLIPDSITIGIGSPLELFLLYNDPDYTSIRPEIRWECRRSINETTMTTDDKCPDFNADTSDGADMQKTVEFFGEGR